MVGCLLLSVTTGPVIWSTFGPHGARNDFLSFYAGAKLLPTRELYRLQPTLELERRIAAQDSAPVAEISYIRLPFYAALLKPLARLPYRAAYAVFQSLSLLAFVWSIASWRRFGPGACIVLAASCGGMAFALLRGQDSAFVLFLLSVSSLLLSPQAALQCWRGSGIRSDQVAFAGGSSRCW